MRTHQQIIEAGGGPSAVARSINADPNTVKAWKRSDSIPAPWWAAIAGASLATLEELAVAAESRRVTS